MFPKKKIEMNAPLLIQRLNAVPKNHKGVLSDFSNPFAFGGGLKNGGLSDNIIKIFNEIFSFDYMGAAEFEFGALPDAISKMVKNIKNYINVEFYAKTKEGKEVLVYAICHKDIKDDTIEWIKTKAYREYDGNHTHETVALNRSINDDTSYNLGWLDLDNGTFFFIDKKMFESIKKVFEIKG